MLDLNRRAALVIRIKFEWLVKLAYKADSKLITYLDVKLPKLPILHMYVQMSSCI